MANTTTYKKHINYTTIDLSICQLALNKTSIFQWKFTMLHIEVHEPEVTQEYIYERIHSYTGIHELRNFPLLL